MIASAELTGRIRHWADEEGFDQCGIAPAIDSQGFHRLTEWIDSGYAGQMHYFADRLDAYRHPSGVLAGAKSVVVMTLPYASQRQSHSRLGQGKVARYAWQGDDYHDVIHPKLKRICKRLGDAAPGTNARGVVDTAPLMEREVAQLAGLGWRGKNTLLLNRDRGSYFFLASILVDIELVYDIPHHQDHCGTCTACLDACPTDAFPQAGVIDASRCISYLTIEHRESIPDPLRKPMGDWLFGCDVCQEVCPWNRKHGSDRQSSRLESVQLTALFALGDDEFRQRFRKTPLWRTRRRGILRNAAIVLGNQADPGAVAALAVGISDDEELVRQASAWALGQIGDPMSLDILRCRREMEKAPSVINEIGQAIDVIFSVKGDVS